MAEGLFAVETLVEYDANRPHIDLGRNAALLMEALGRKVPVRPRSLGDVRTLMINAINGYL